MVASLSSLHQQFEWPYPTVTSSINHTSFSDSQLQNNGEFFIQTNYLLKFFLSQMFFLGLMLFLFSAINPFQPSVAFHIETSHLISSANQITGFSMKYNTGQKWVNLFTLGLS